MKALLLVLTLALAAPVAAQNRIGDATTRVGVMRAMQRDLDDIQAAVIAAQDAYYVDNGRFCQTLQSREVVLSASQLPQMHDQKTMAPHYTSTTGSDCLGAILDDNDLATLRCDIVTFGSGGDDNGVSCTFGLNESTEVITAGFSHCHVNADAGLCASRMPPDQPPTATPKP